MKKFTIILLVLAASASFAQNAPINFEPGGQGANWTWTVFENDTNPPVEIITNPDQSELTPLLQLQNLQLCKPVILGLAANQHTVIPILGLSFWMPQILSLK